MTPFCRQLFFAASFLVLAGSPRTAAQSFADLLKRAPADANAIILVDVASILKSPLAVKERWAEKHRTDYTAGAIGIPPAVDKLVVTAQVNPGNLENVWEIALAVMNRDVAPADIARGEAGTPDKVAGQPVVLSPRGSYYVTLGPRMLAAQRPANRQQLARWLQQTARTTQSGLSPYLQAAAASVGRPAPIVMAFDTTDVLDPEGVRTRLKRSRSLANQKVDPEQLTQLFTGMRGVQFALRVDQAIRGELRLDFATPPAALAPVAKPLILDALEAIGAANDEVAQWTSRLLGTTIVLEGGLSPAGARRLLSHFSLQTATPQVPSQAAGSKPAQDEGAGRAALFPYGEVDRERRAGAEGENVQAAGLQLPPGGPEDRSNPHPGRGPGPGEARHRRGRYPAGDGQPLPGHRFPEQVPREERVRGLGHPAHVRPVRGLRRLGLWRLLPGNPESE
jgi:hypothetical protein